jgi:hypothetical protein
VIVHLNVLYLDVHFFGPPNMPVWIKMVVTHIKTFLKRRVYCLHMYLVLKIVLLQLNYVGLVRYQYVLNIELWEQSGEIKIVIF